MVFCIRLLPRTRERNNSLRGRNMGTISRSRDTRSNFAVVRAEVPSIRGMARINIEIEQVENINFRKMFACALHKANSHSEEKRTSSRRYPGLERVYSDACRSAFYARHICNTYNIERGERDIILTACILMELVRETGGTESFFADQKDTLQKYPEIRRIISIFTHLLAPGRSWTRKLKELFKGGDRIEIVIGLSLLSANSGTC
jgi:hypothetical protein